MKNLLLTIIAITTFTSFAKANQDAFQDGADQMTEIIRCQPLKLHPDLSMSVSVATGGIAGLTQVRVQRYFSGYSTVEIYIVKQQEADPSLASTATTFIGNGIRLTANFATRLPNGKYYGTLQLGNTQNSSIEQLACDLTKQNPQVNYSF